VEGEAGWEGKGKFIKMGIKVAGKGSEIIYIYIYKWGLMSVWVKQDPGGRWEGEGVGQGRSKATWNFS
jgi:hypothetical protein